MIYGALIFNSRWISRMYIVNEQLDISLQVHFMKIWVICRRLLGCGHPSRSSTAGITSWSTVTWCLLPKSENWSSFVVDVFPFIGCDFYRIWPWTTQRVCDFWLNLLKPMTKYQIAAINSYWEKCYEYLGTNGRTEVKQYSPFRWSGGIIKLLWHMNMHRTKFQACKLQLKHMKLTWQTLEWSWG